MAQGVQSPAGAGAHDCGKGPAMHQDFQGTACEEFGHDSPHENIIEVDGGRDRKLAFRVYPPWVTAIEMLTAQMRLK